MSKGLRFNEGKTRHDLVPGFAQEQYARVLTAGAAKYGDSNWKQGLEWTTVIASMKRHVLALESGEDYDPETGEYHSAHIMCNAAFITEYYKIYPQGDNRAHTYATQLKIGLDIDEVLADFTGKWMKDNDMDEAPVYWSFERGIGDKLATLSKEWWLSLLPKIDPLKLPFEPHCYITSRSIPAEWTEEWIDKTGFPQRPVYSVGFEGSKLEAIKASGCDVFVDDCFDHFIEINNAGILCYLFDAPHNRRYNVGHKRIKSLNELK